jgi:hypothetical protein
MHGAAAVRGDRVAHGLGAGAVGGDATRHRSSPRLRGDEVLVLEDRHDLCHRRAAERAVGVVSDAGRTMIGHAARAAR